MVDLQLTLLYECAKALPLSVRCINHIQYTSLKIIYFQTKKGYEICFPSVDTHRLCVFVRKEMSIAMLAFRAGQLWLFLSNRKKNIIGIFS